LPSAFQNLGNLSAAGLSTAANQLAGQTQGSFAPVGFTAGAQFLNLMLNPYIEGRGAPVGAGSVIPGSAQAYADEPAATPAAQSFNALALAPRQALSGRIESGYRLPYGLVAITPYGAVQTQAMFLPSYGEYAQAGSSAQFALNYASQTATTTRTELGAWFDSDALLPTAQNIKLYSRLAWAHDFDNEGISTTFFQSLPGSSFLVNSVKPARDGALTTVGFEYRLADGWSLLGKFDGEFSATTAIFAGSGTIRYLW
jgi:outer membrane autotransporter protein